MTNKKKYERASALVEQGSSKIDACKKYNLGISTYGYYRKQDVAPPLTKQTRAATKKTDSRLIYVPGLPAPTARLMVFYGNPTELTEIARTL